MIAEKENSVIMVNGDFIISQEIWFGNKVLHGKAEDKIRTTHVFSKKS